MDGVEKITAPLVLNIEHFYFYRSKGLHKGYDKERNTLIYYTCLLNLHGPI